MVTELNESTFDAFIDDNKYVLIDCWAPWCGPCRRMGPIIEELSKDLEGKVAVAKLNTDESPGISARFEINAIPTLLIFKDKVMLEPLVGLRPKEDIISVLADRGMIEGGKKKEEEAHFAAKVTDNDFNEFIKSKDYALVDCWAPWCKPCLRMGPVIEELAKISQDDIAVGKLNVDENPGVSLSFNIQSIPALLIFKGGKQVGTIVGYSPERTAEALREAILSA
ncbi:MAG: thioredoxin [Methanomassiliicoccales archaeon]|uniref:thioredoxin n=1 Tax=Candidatus Methanarcanum hacksteinii TaxID=2911857 RepID=UPI002A795E2B|nr:thioredoxin [Candidatus Methanomethylophilaceae archaeon]MCI6024904.1 thioredoxin [Methanomassiliicoccales archaeon]MDD7479419.1 thioredoxin [Methanomassiliicoccales archaeon]MDY4580086.1 thioredoxin [Candidatus Methanarcanum hacksteinii]